MKLTPHELEHTSDRTLQYYNESADAFWEGTRGHDVSQNVAALLHHIESTPPYRILDLGCGPGRDLKTFSDLGRAPVGLEGCARFVEMARGRGTRCGSRTS